MSWSEFLRHSDAEMRRNEMNRGLTYYPAAGALTIDVVAEYMAGFGWCGVGAREVVQACQRDERGVKRALAQLVEDGQLRVTESLTRGPKASKRKTYWPVQNTGPVNVVYDELAEFQMARSENEYGCGGGREIRPKLVDERPLTIR